jgi:hypothetical protein
MTKEDKIETICQWIDPEQRVTVHFSDERGLNAEVTGSMQNMWICPSRPVCLTSDNVCRYRSAIRMYRKTCPRTREILSGH